MTVKATGLDHEDGSGTARPVTSVYLAGRYGRKQELRERGRELEALGIEVTSGWLSSAVASLSGLSEAEWREIALLDREDVRRADLLVLFAEPPGDGGSGGRHVEFGMALAWSKPVVVVGRREHVFHRLPEVTVVDDWGAAVALLRQLRLA